MVTSVYSLHYFYWFNIAINTNYWSTSINNTQYYNCKYLVEDEEKLKQPIRFLYLVYYFIKYITIIEFRAHMDVVKRIFTMDINPGIVRVPVASVSRYARLLVMSSITNTPGTVVVDEKNDYFYVNWINVTTTDPLKSKRE